MSEKFLQLHVDTSGRCPSLPKLGSCKVPSQLSSFLVLRTARKCEASLRASPVETGGQGNCFCVFLYHFVLLQPNFCVDREVGLELLCLLV